MKKLIEQLNQYRDAYYNRSESLVSDRKYDALFDKLKEMEKQTGIVYPNSPTQSVGYEVISNLTKVTHEHPLLSLDKDTDMDAFARYFGNNACVIMAKEDGLTASIHYQNGVMVSAESRGNGIVGEDITHTAKTFVNLPQRIPFDGDLWVDGECIITFDTFEEINKGMEKKFKHPRSLASGTVRQLDSEVAAKRKVRFIAWKLYSAVINGEDIAPKLHSERFVMLHNFGFEVVPFALIQENHQLVMPLTIETLKQTCERLQQPIDGMVGMFDNVEYGISLGFTNRFPKHSLAFKFYQEDNETTLKTVEWSTSRTGVVNPVAVFEPVEIDGTTVERASLSNVSIIEELELGYGDTITVIKANQIIPMVTGNLTRSNTCEIPTTCPTCGKKLILQNANGRKVLMCKNDSCPAQSIEKFSHFVGRSGMNIVGLSKQTVTKMIDCGLINEFADFYKLSGKIPELAAMDGFTERSAMKLLNAICDSRVCELTDVLVAIGIPDVGKATAKLMAEAIHNSENQNKLVALVEMAGSGYDWTVIDGIGELTSDKINRFVVDEEESILNLSERLEIKGRVTSSGGSLNGKTFCLSGNFVNGKAALGKAVENCGGKVVSGVSKKTNYLVCNDTESTSSKNKKAREIGVAIINESELLVMVGMIPTKD